MFYKLEKHLILSLSNKLEDDLVQEFRIIHGTIITSVYIIRMIAVIC